jgi:hypothetical protein
MDVTRLYNLTTPELRAEAQRLGVSGTGAMTRAQLIQVVRGQLGAPQTDGFLGRMFGFAKKAFNPAELGENPGDLRPSSSARAFESDPPKLPAPRPSASPEPPASQDAAQQRALATALGHGAPTASDGGSSRPKPGAPVGVFSVPSQQLICEEPFPTQTMARILAQQGHYKRSLAIYMALLRKSPSDPELQREADAVRLRTQGLAPR